MVCTSVLFDICRSPYVNLPWFLYRACSQCTRYDVAYVTVQMLGGFRLSSVLFNLPVVFQCYCTSLCQKSFSATPVVLLVADRVFPAAVSRPRPYTTAPTLPSASPLAARLLVSGQVATLWSVSVAIQVEVESESPTSIGMNTQVEDRRRPTTIVVNTVTPVKLRLMIRGRV